MKVAQILSLGAVGWLACFTGFSQPLPVPAPGGPPNIYYGATPPNLNGSTLVFVHGLRGIAQDWWVNNDMYSLAYQLGYKTAFINLNLDGTPNDASIVNNAAVLTAAFPLVANRLGVPNFYVVGHSKGGIDTQAAALEPTVAQYVKGVFTASTPHQGTVLADWAFGAGAPIAGPLGLQTPGVAAVTKSNMQAFRSIADAAGPFIGIHFYNMAGITSAGNPLTAITGAVLSALAPLQSNDGLVTPADTILPLSYATNLGLINQNHFQTNTGSLILPRIHAQIHTGVPTNFLRVDNGSGFGDRQNSFPWSQQWFKGKLYVGTGRAFLCVTAATSDAQQGTNIYQPSSADLECAPTPSDLALRAEIWRFTPETKVWEKVFQSPQSVPLTFDALGNPTKFTARDIAFRGMTVFKEADGTEVLYVGGVTSSMMFDQMPPYSNPGVTPFPPPRILRSVDGVNWAALPQTPGTFLGDIYKNSTPNRIRIRGFRSLLGYKGKLFATASDFRGVGMVVASANPAAGDNAWFQASQGPETIAAWTMHLFNNFLYVTTGDRTSTNGYGVHKTDATGSAPYFWQPVVTDGAFQIESIRSPDALSIQDLNGALYVGSDRPTEMIRIYPDDTWDLVVGAPRNTPFGFKVPLSGLVTGFGNIFNGHFWRMKTHQNRLYVGTWDWSMTLRNFGVLGTFFKDIMGADLYSTTNGVVWNFETKTGFGDIFNYGVRTMQSTPFGLFVGTANPFYGLQMWRNPFIMDLNGDRTINQLDVNLVLAAINTTVPPGDPRDLDQDGRITINDARKLITQCVIPGCAVQAPAAFIDAPGALQVAPQSVSGPTAMLSWQPSPGAVRYTVYRQDMLPVLTVVPPNLQIQIPGTNITLTIAQILAGAADSLCQGVITAEDCEAINLLKQNAPVPGKVKVAGQTTSTLTFQDTQPPPAAGPAVYFVKAESSAGRFSAPSNLVSGPSAAPGGTFASLSGSLMAAAEKTGSQQDSVNSLIATALDSSSALASGNVRRSRIVMEGLEMRVRKIVALYGLNSSVWTQLQFHAEQLSRSLRYVEAGYLPESAVLRRGADRPLKLTTTLRIPAGR